MEIQARVARRLFVTPDEEQSLGDQPVTWQIIDASAKAPAVSLYVEVASKGKRRDGLLWTVAGSSEDMPSLRLPVSQKWLDNMTTQIRTHIGKLRQLQSIPSSSVPRSMSTELSARNDGLVIRSNLENA